MPGRCAALAVDVRRRGGSARCRAARRARTGDPPQAGGGAVTLGFETRWVLVALASYAVVSTAASLLLAAGLRSVLARLVSRSPSPRTTADRILLLRLLPCLFGALCAVAASLAFALFEPRTHGEAVGWPFVCAATAGAVLLLLALGRGARSALASLAVGEVWSAGSPARTPAPLAAREVEADFPVVALSGLWRPRLVLARRVADACSEEEMQAVVAHEMAHLHAHDNVRQAVLTLCPDLFALLPAARVLERSWREAAERAADEAATAGDESRRLALASALVKVARLAVGPRAPVLPGSTLLRGEPIAERVRSLLSPPASDALDRSGVAGLGGSPRGAAGLALLAVSSALFAASRPELFELVEAAIRLGR
ncbi:MAG: hypothetical protein DWQ36_19490 [Acidobacteria bacterium]|nr:MAG: hypothetical protein DWQ36_19490 [Acidobacteriota bacterium]